MDKQHVQEHVEEALSCPILARRLQRVVTDIDQCVPVESTRSMMYELVDIVLQMGQRVRALETRVASGDVQSELSKLGTYMPERKINYGRDFPSEDDHARHRG